MKLQPFVKGTILYQSIWHLAWVITLGRLPALTKLVQVRWAVKTPRGVNIYGYCDFFFRFFNKATAHTREPILAYNSSKDAVWCKEDSFEHEKCVILKFGVFHPKSTPKIGRNRQLPAKNKMSNNSETVRDTLNMSMNHDYETGIALSNSVNKTCVKRP